MTHCAEIKITPCGRWLVAPNRKYNSSRPYFPVIRGATSDELRVAAGGHDSIAVFGVDGTTGTLTLLVHNQSASCVWLTSVLLRDPMRL